MSSERAELDAESAAACFSKLARTHPFSFFRKAFCTSFTPRRKAFAATAVINNQVSAGQFPQLILLRIVGNAAPTFANCLENLFGLFLVSHRGRNSAHKGGLGR